jgi:hypothetical protein
MNSQDFSGGLNNSTTPPKFIKDSLPDADTPQKVVIAGIYELLFGQGKLRPAEYPGVVNQIIGGCS